MKGSEQTQARVPWFFFGIRLANRVTSMSNDLRWHSEHELDIETDEQLRIGLTVTAAHHCKLWLNKEI